MSKTKDRILNCAQELMLSKGFVATSLDDICRKAGITKGGFFHYFKSKEDLGKILLNRFCCSSREAMQACCCGAHDEKDPLRRIHSYIDFTKKMARETVKGKGCLIGTFAQELSESHPGIRSLCAKGFEEWAKVLKKDMKDAKAKYAPKAPFDPASLAEHFIAIVEGSQILAKAKKDSKLMEKNLQHFENYLKTLFKN